MPVTPKSKTIQLRVDPELFAKFSEEVEYYGDATVSSTLRMMMRKFIQEMEYRRNRLAKEAEWAATLESRRQATSVPPASQKPPVGPPDKPEGPVARRMRLKKEAKGRRKAHDVSDDDLDVDYDDE